METNRLGNMEGLIGKLREQTLRRSAQLKAQSESFKSLKQMMEESLKKMDRILEMEGLLTGSRTEEEEEAVGHDNSFPPSLMAFPSVVPPARAPSALVNPSPPSSQPHTQLWSLPVPPSQLPSQDPPPPQPESSLEAKNREKMSLWKRSTEKDSLHSTIAAGVALDNNNKPTPTLPLAPLSLHPPPLPPSPRFENNSATAVPTLGSTNQSLGRLIIHPSPKPTPSPPLSPTPTSASLGFEMRNEAAIPSKTSPNQRVRTLEMSWFDKKNPDRRILGTERSSTKGDYPKFLAESNFRIERKEEGRAMNPRRRPPPSPPWPSKLLPPGVEAKNRGKKKSILNKEGLTECKLQTPSSLNEVTEKVNLGYYTFGLIFNTLAKNATWVSFNINIEQAKDLTMELKQKPRAIPNNSYNLKTGRTIAPTIATNHGVSAKAWWKSVDKVTTKAPQRTDLISFKLTKTLSPLWLSMLIVSNYLNNNIAKIYVVTEFQLKTINCGQSRVRTSNIGCFKDEGLVEVSVVQQSQEQTIWFNSTARRTVGLYGEQDAPEYLLLEGNHLYLMDYGKKHVSETKLIQYFDGREAVVKEIGEVENTGQREKVVTYLLHVASLLVSSCKFKGKSDLDDKDFYYRLGNSFDGVSSDEETLGEPNVGIVGIRSSVLEEKTVATKALGLFALILESVYVPHLEESMGFLIRLASLSYEDTLKVVEVTVKMIGRFSKQRDVWVTDHGGLENTIKRIEEGSKLKMTDNE